MPEFVFNLISHITRRSPQVFALIVESKIGLIHDSSRHNKHIVLGKLTLHEISKGAHTALKLAIVIILLK